MALKGQLMSLSGGKSGCALMGGAASEGAPFCPGVFARAFEGTKPLPPPPLLLLLGPEEPPPPPLEPEQDMHILIAPYNPKYIYNPI